MSARAASAPGAGVLDRLQVLRSAPTPLRGALAATWTPSPRTGVGPLRVPGPGLQPSSHDTTTTRTDPAGSTLARPDFGPKDGVHLSVRLNEPRLKQLTGRDPVTCRFLHREFFTFTPMFVLFLATNEKPEIRDYSDGFWERVHLVPFTHQFMVADRDPTVKTRLKGDKEHLMALLAWAVNGCLFGRKRG